MSQCPLKDSELASVSSVVQSNRPRSVALHNTGVTLNAATTSTSRRSRKLAQHACCAGFRERRCEDERVHVTRRGRESVVLVARASIHVPVVIRTFEVKIGEDRTKLNYISSWDTFTAQCCLVLGLI